MQFPHSDADLEVCLSKCKICASCMQEERAEPLIRACIEDNVSGTLTPLRPNLEVIQVHGLCVVGAPVGASRNVREYARNQRFSTAKLPKVRRFKDILKPPYLRQFSC